jgi:hypothetical protein
VAISDVCCFLLKSLALKHLVEISDELMVMSETCWCPREPYEDQRNSVKEHSGQPVQTETPQRIGRILDNRRRTLPRDISRPLWPRDWIHVHPGRAAAMATRCLHRRRRRQLLYRIHHNCTYHATRQMNLRALQTYL